MDGRFDDERGLAAALTEWARLAPERLALRFLDEQGETPLTYRELDARARAIARRLLVEAAPGARAVLLFPSGPEYVAAFFGCLYAGVIAVPAYPPESLRPQHLARLHGILANCEPRLVLTQGSLQATLQQACGQGAKAPVVLATDELPLPADWQPCLPAPEQVAFLQYTSGSTATPKGVEVTHGNLAANEAAIRQGFGIGSDDVIVSWLPLYHDMGLIGGLLQAIYSGIPCVLMSPLHFLQRPLRWLQAVARYGGTVSGGPDFAYRLCAERLRDSAVAGLDLSRWRVAFSGAEPIRPDTLDLFAERFAPAGFDPAAFMACYGLAEATLYVSGGLPGGGIGRRSFDRAALAAGRGAAGTDLQLAACGYACPGQHLLLVDADSGALTDSGQVGEIWTSGPSVARGYWRNPVATAETFVEREGRRWLRTGDLGVLQDGELFVTGRLKDLLILRGQNLYPQDIELTVEMAAPALRKGRVAAFAVSDASGTPGIGIAAEIARNRLRDLDTAALVATIRQAVTEVHGEAPQRVALLEPGGMPKTSSGKLQRSACRRLLEAGELPLLATAVPVAVAVDTLDALEGRLAALWEEVLDVRPQQRAAHFFALGGNSLKAVQLTSRVREQLGLELSLATLFAAPTLGELAQHLSAAAADAEPALVALSEAEHRQLSPAQNRLWFLWRLEPDNAAYNLAGRLHLRGSLDHQALQKALDGLVARHAPLRTRMIERAGQPEAEVLPAAPVEIRYLPANPAALDQAADAPFALDTGPLLRVAVLSAAEQRHTLQLCTHHSAADGWSLNLLLEEFAEGYRAALQDTQPAWTPLAIAYGDFARWQRARLAGVEGGRQIRYWQQRLAGVPEVLALPLDRPRTAAAQGPAAELTVTLDNAQTEALRRLAVARGVTLPMLLLAAFQQVLSRYGRQRDFCIGVTMAGRNRRELEPLVGFFVNLLPLRLALAEDATVDTLLAQVRDELLAAQACGELPFEQIVEALRPQRLAGIHPLFQVVYDHQWRPAAELAAWPGLEVEAFALVQRQTPFDLSMHTLECGTALSARLVYRCDLFERETLEAFAERWLGLLEQLAAPKATPVAHLAWQSPAQARAQVLAWNQRPCQTQPGLRWAAADLAGLIEAQAARQPQASAVTWGTARLSYADLNARANALAHELQRRGVGAEVLVGLAVERSLELVVGLLAILKAGGAYLPLDPSYPAQRLAFMCDDSGARLLLTSRGLLDDQPWAQDRETLYLDDWAEQRTAANPLRQVHPEHLAYVIYTSGSTGTPKGVQVTQGNVLRLFESASAEFRFDAQDVWTLFHAYAFDFSVWEVFGALLHGGRLVVVPWLTSRSPESLQALLQEEGVTVLSQTPSAFRGLIPVAVADPRPLPLRYVIFGGEALEPALLRPWFERFGAERPRLVNMYGITETTVHVTARTLAVADLDGPSLIGTPLADLDWYLLDARGEPVPPGMVGELHIGGAGLARGYLGRPGLTAERFVAHPWVAGTRLYRTGDLARWSPETGMQYLGRADRQVQLRGFRIELGEVEAQLRAVPRVADALVRLRRDASGAEVLVGYALAASGAALDESGLRECLRQALPAQAVPARLFVLPQWPLTVNGKLDEAGLPEPQHDGQERQHQPPQGATETALAELWAQALGRARVSRTANFFELGGHSLLAVQLLARINQRLGVELPLRELFAAADLAALARRVELVQRHAPTAAVDQEVAAALAALEGLSEAELLALAERADQENLS
ncbi:amino acid adenylation domain-containing protein [Pseudomonas benzopyrenica]|uniref:amino acid adenylation domain-containing protein n=1 Tax=Pseudomonas benzopyrenica TaxID=2993566 RepID=UPI0039C4B7C7